MSALNLKRAEVGPWPMNSYALICPETGRSALVDPGAEPDTLMALLEGSTPTMILLTHTHPDHVGALDEMRRRLGVPVHAFDGPHLIDPAEDERFRDGDQIHLGAQQLRVIHAPGHIDDQVCLRIERDHRVIVGDTIFQGGPGKTWSSEGFQATLRTLRDRVLPWPDDTLCHPGHGPIFRLGDQRPAIVEFLAKDHGDFFGDATWAM